MCGGHPTDRRAFLVALTVAPEEDSTFRDHHPTPPPLFAGVSPEDRATFLRVAEQVVARAREAGAG